MRRHCPECGVRLSRGTPNTTRDGPLDDNIAERSGEWFHPPAITVREWWVAWILDGEGRKRPVAPWETGHAYPVKWNNDLAEAERPETDYSTARRWVEFSLDDLGLSLPDDAQSDDLALGLILPAERGPREERVTLIDWDDVRDPETGEIHPVAAEFIKRYGGYVEISTSGEGLHQFVIGGLRHRGKFIAPIDEEPFIGDDLPQVEIYDGGRHVAMTGKHVAGTDHDLIESQECIDEIVTKYADAEQDAGHRRFDPENGERSAAADDQDDLGGQVPKPDIGDYSGPSLEALRERKPTDRSLDYHAVIETFYRGGGNASGDANIQNWRLEGLAAALGERDDLDADQVKDDLGGAYLDDTDVDQGAKHRTPERVEYGHDRAASGRLHAPSVETLVDYGVLPPEILDDSGEDNSDEQHSEPDPRNLFDDPVVVEPRDAWRAAGAVRPNDLDAGEDGREVSLGVTDDGDAWETDEGRRVDGIVRAVALEENLIDVPDTDLGTDTFDEAYRRARRHYGAPLPEYVDETTATDQKWILYGALDQIGHYHLNGIRSTVIDTGEGDVVAEINPAWEYSASGHRVLAFRSGWFYCREHGTSLDALRFVALEEEILDGCTDDLEGEAFLDAVDALRDRGAPVPRYDGEMVDHEAVLPEAADLLEEFTTDADHLNAARQDVEAAVEEAAADATQADLVKALPALGKTTSTVKNAVSQPTLYAAPRKELQTEVLEKAEEYGVSTYTLPVLAENHIRRDAKAEGAAAVRDVGQDLLRRRDELVDRIESDIHPDPDAEDVADDDEADLDRATCPTANGANGEAWQVAVQVAAELRYNPETIHKRSKALFGEQIPCTCDEDGEAVKCPYSQAWKRVADPDRPVDLLVGSRTHAHVRSAKTWYGRDASDRVDLEPRAVAIDEFPDDAYGRRYRDEAPTIATWLGTALQDDLDDQRDILEAGVWATWICDWVHGSDSGDALPAFRDLDRRVDACRLLLDARDEIATLQPEDRSEAAEALRAAVDRGVGRDTDATDLYDLTDAALASVRELDTLPGSIARNLGALLDDLRAALSDVDGSVGEPDLTVEGDRLGETFRDVVDTALDGALEAGADHALEAARDVCRGGEAGTAALAVHADDPYADPDAYLLLAGMVGEGETVRTQQFQFDRTRAQTHLTRTRLDGATVLFDRDHAGAYVLNPPEFTDVAGRDCPVVGLDATGRETLWSLALGEDVRQRDIHDSARERRKFLRDVLNLQVVQTSPHVNSYSHVANKNFDGDVELIRTVAEEYGTGRLRADTLSAATAPGVITTKKARQQIEGRIGDIVREIDHYGNVTGSNALAECNIGIVLGSRHFGDAAVEKWAAFAGEEVTRTGHGADLSYGSDVAEDYLAHMREDETMQSILRFGRDEEGALVFVHTSAIAEGLPVVGDGAVVSAHSSGGVEVRDAMLPYLKRGRSFTVSDLIDDVDAGRRTVQRKLREFADLGYVEREDAGVGRANTFTPAADPGHGDVELPSLDAPGVASDDTEPLEQYNTGIVGVRDNEISARGPPGGAFAQIPAPTTADTIPDGVEPPG